MATNNIWLRRNVHIFSRYVIKSCNRKIIYIFWQVTFFTLIFLINICEIVGPHLHNLFVLPNYPHFCQNCPLTWFTGSHNFSRGLENCVRVYWISGLSAESVIVFIFDHKIIPCMCAVSQTYKVMVVDM